MNKRENAELFEKLFGAPCTDVYSAAGRVNIIGEHIDYCGGRVLPAAIGLRCNVYARKTGSDVIRIAATTFGRVETLDISSLARYKDLEWGSYQAGVAYIMQSEGYDLVGCDLLYDCSVPFGSGLSSSAAIEVATAVALAAMADRPLDPVKAAVMARRAENEYCGVACGIMDQFASAMGKKNRAVLLDCKTLEYEYIPFDLGGYVMVIADSNKRHSLTDGKYNERRAETDEGLRIIAEHENVTCLAEVTPEMFGRVRGRLRPVVAKRVEHVVRECERVERAADALRRGDIAELGRLLDESHESLSSLYEVTGKELDTLVRIERSRPGCIGARMIGAGFGGSTIAVVREDAVDGFMRETAELYEKEIGYAPTFYRTTASDGITRKNMLGLYIPDFLLYAEKKLGLPADDRVYAANSVLRYLGEESYEECGEAKCAESASEAVYRLRGFAEARGAEGNAEYIESELFDRVSPRPSQLITSFRRACARNREKAFDAFYDLCVACDYVKSAAIERNKRWKAEGTRRPIEVTINLSKPEKDNKQTAKLRGASAGYPKCMICAENEGYAGQGRCRQTLRTVPLKINGEDWFWQFSPYAYFDRHGIAINRTHTPMTLDSSTAAKLADFVDGVPGYFIGCNAPLPIVGGSILAHEHFQGGKYFFPMFGCALRSARTIGGAEVGVLDWYNSVVTVRTPDREELIRLCNAVISKWNGYSVPELDIIASDGEQHNTATFIMRKDGGEYVAYIILRNNRCDARYPDGIFHVHPEYMNIKSESIGLIEAMGMFILPARLDRQLAEVAQVLTGERERLSEGSAVHRGMTERLKAEHGTGLTKEEAERVVRRAVDSACEHILENTAVFKEDERGRAAFEAFVTTALEAAE